MELEQDSKTCFATEQIIHNEYKEYIQRLLKKPLMNLDYSELTDLVDHYATLGDYKTALRMAVLAMNQTNGQVHALQSIIVEHLKKS